MTKEYTSSGYGYEFIDVLMAGSWVLNYYFYIRSQLSKIKARITDDNTNQAEQATYSLFTRNEKLHKGTLSSGTENSLYKFCSSSTWISWAQVIDFRLLSAMNFSVWPSYSKIINQAPPSPPSKHPSQASHIRTTKTHTITPNSLKPQTLMTNFGSTYKVRYRLDKLMALVLSLVTHTAILLPGKDITVLVNLVLWVTS